MTNWSTNTLLLDLYIRIHTLPPLINIKLCSYYGEFLTICLRNIKSFFVESWNLKKGKVIKHANGVGLKTLMDGIFELSSFNRFFSQFRVLQSRFGIQIRLFQTQYSSSVLLLFIDQIKNFYMVCYYHNYFTMHKYYFWRDTSSHCKNKI